MKIQSSDISLYAKYQKTQFYERSESLTLRRGDALRANESISPPSSPFSIQPAVISEISNPNDTEPVKVGETSSELEEIGKMIYDMKLSLIEKLIEAFTGRKINLAGHDIGKAFSDSAEQVVRDQAANSNRENQTRPIEISSPKISYELHERIEEHESLNFKAHGFIQTADGKNIDFSVDLNMSQSFIQQTDIYMEMGGQRPQKLIDPIVLNFGGSADVLSETKFSFDIDADGTEDQISMLKPGSGFLALDKNGNGKIDDGSELFGPNTGNGFEELTAFDSDQNGWIDENDPIFNQLRIWSADENGQFELLTLGEAGVGALYLDNLSTQFDHKASNGELMGQLKASGIFVKEDGSVAMMQELDFAV